VNIGLRRCLVALFVACTVALVSGQSPAALLFQEGLLLERAEGRVQEAIARYERVIAEFPGDRVAGDARTRLTALVAQGVRGITSRMVVSGDAADQFGSISPDARSLSFVDDTGNLAILDLASGERRRVTHTAAGFREFAEYSVFSPDGSKLAYGWSNAASIYELRTIGRDGSAMKMLFSNGEWLRPFDWSPDGRDILAIIVHANRTRQLVYVSAADGSIRGLRTLDWNMALPFRAEFSPDGRFIAYERATLVNGARGDEDVFVIAADGSRETVVATGPSNERFLGWFPDGQSILVSSDRTGSVGAWAVPLRDGQRQGDLRLVKPDLGRIWPKGFDRNGHFLYHLSVGLPDIYTATVDPRTWQVVKQPAPLAAGIKALRALPDWSTDGKQLAFKLDGLRVGIHDMTTEVVRQVPMKLTYAEAVTWTPDGRAFTVIGRDLNARGGVFKVDAATGAAESLGVEEGGLSGAAALTADGERVFYRRFIPQPPNPVGAVVSVRNLRTGQIQELFRDVVGGPYSFQLSHDERWLALRVSSPDGTQALQVMPSSGGSARVILRDKASDVPLGGGRFAWMPDGAHILLVRGGAVWRIPVNGGDPVKLDLAAPGLNGVTVSRDGRQLALAVQDVKEEVWALENLVSAARTDRP